MMEGRDSEMLETASADLKTLQVMRGGLGPEPNLPLQLTPRNFRRNCDKEQPSSGESC